MKGKRIWVALVALVMMLSSLTACGDNKTPNKPDTEKETQQNTEQSTQQDTQQDEQKPDKVVLTDKALAGETLIDFTKGANSAVVFESDGWTNGDVFNVVWTKDNVKYAAGKMALSITKENKNAWLNDKEVTFPYTAGEARTQNYYGYGDYEVKMKPSANEGTASTFFICTGNYDEKYVLDANGNVVSNPDGTIQTVKNPHDEIDIEFLGKDTTKVQFNFFVNGKGGNEFMYDLGFDASKEYHEYGFRWEKDSITWFVDDKPVYKVTTNKTAKAGENVKIVDAIPATPGRILMNYWCGNEDAVGWMGEYKGNVKDNGCEYLWLSSTAKGAPLNPDVKQPGSDGIDFSAIKWDSIAAINPTFASTDKYTVTTTGTSSNVKYTNVGGSTYINVEMDITEASKQKNVIHLTLKNNGSKDANVRVNIVDQQLLDKGAKNSSTNRNAVLDGVEVKTDLEWGGSFFDIKAGQTGEAVIYYIGEVEKLQLMIDSARNDAGTYSGDITISNIKFEKQGDIVDENTVGKYKIEPFETMKIMKSTNILNVRDLPHVSGNKIGYLQNGEIVKVTGKCKETGWYRIVIGDKVGYVSAQFMVDEANGVPKPSDANSIYINRVEYTFNPNEYTLQSGADSSLNVKYKDLPGESYKNFSTKIDNISSEYNKFTTKIKNNGTKTVEFRIDIASKTQINANHNKANIYTLVDGVEAYTDLEWGGSKFAVEAGKTVTVEIFFDATKGADSLEIFLDSHIYQDPEATHTGDVTFLSMAFGKGEAPVQPEEPSEPEEPSQPSEPSEPGSGDEGADSSDNTLEVNGQERPFTNDETNNAYTIAVNDTEKTLNIKYSNLVGNSYANFGTDINALSRDFNRFTTTVKNNGSATVTVRIDIIATQTSGESNITQCNSSSMKNGLDADSNTDLTYGGSTFSLAAGETATLVVNFDKSKDAQKLTIFVDSSTWDDETTHTGNVTFSNMEFSTADFVALDNEYIAGSLTSNKSNGDAGITNLRLGYTGDGPDWGGTAGFFAPTNLDGKNKFSATVYNNGTTDVKVRFDLKNTGNVGAVVSATANNGVTPSIEMDGEVKAGAAVVLKPGQSTRITITFDTATDLGKILIFPGSGGRPMDPWDGPVDSNITVSDFKFE